MAFISGKVKHRRFDEGRALALGKVYLARWLEQFQGQQVYAAWFFGATPITLERLLDIAINTVEGNVDADLHATYSDYTGFLWVDEDGNIGGHDVLKTFEAHLKEYGALVVQTDPIDFTESALLLQEAEAEKRQLETELIGAQQALSKAEAERSRRASDLIGALEKLMALTDIRWNREDQVPRLKFHCPHGHASDYTVGSRQVTFPPTDPPEIGPLVLVCKTCGHKFYGTGRLFDLEMPCTEGVWVEDDGMPRGAYLHFGR